MGRNRRARWSCIARCVFMPFCPEFGGFRFFSFRSVMTLREWFMLRGHLSWPLAAVSNLTCNIACTALERKKMWDDLEEILEWFGHFIYSRFSPNIFKLDFGFEDVWRWFVIHDGFDRAYVRLVSRRAIRRCFEDIFKALCASFHLSSIGERQVLCVYI